MKYSCMNLATAAASALLLAFGCSKPPTDNVGEFKPDGTGGVHDSSASSEPPFDELTEPAASEPDGGSLPELVPDPSQPVFPSVTTTPPRNKAVPSRETDRREIVEFPDSMTLPEAGGMLAPARIRRSGETQDRRGFTPERVYFATNREPDPANLSGKDPDLYFGGDRGQLVYGTCEVSIPYKRAPGTLPEPSILRLEFSQDPAKHVVLMEVELLPNADFWKRLRTAVDASREKQLLLFVHGYCATFRDAARRTAQMAYDMNYQGPAMFFSWPAGAESEGFNEKVNYLKDLRRAEESDEDLITVLAGISRYSGATSIHLVAHSMGNFVLTEALKTIDDRRPARTTQLPLFDQVALAAPDINAREFVERTGERILPFSRRFTVYASAHDKALRLSKAVNGFEPLGFLNEYSRVGAKKRLFDLVDVSQLTTGWFDSGHIYYGDMPEMISDFSFLFRGIQARSLQRGLSETPPIYRIARRGP